MLISGTTGAGKTNTCLLLLSQAWKLHKIPFIVIETSEKNEYGKLLDGLIGKDMQVFTLGDESRNPLHLDFMHVSPEMRYDLKVPLYIAGTSQTDTRQKGIC